MNIVYLLSILVPICGLDISKPMDRSRGSRNYGTGKSSNPSLNIGLIVPHSLFREKQYRAAVSRAVEIIKVKKRPRFLKSYHLNEKHIHLSMMSVNPSPTVILEILCQTFLKNNVTSIIYMTNSELFGRTTAASQYFLQLAGYLGIPVIAWNADNSGLQSQSRLRVQLAPSIEHQVSSMLSLLIRYNWQQFSVVTSDIAGHDDFIQAIRDTVARMKENINFRFNIQAEVKVTMKEHMSELLQAETRIILLYSTKDEARHIMTWAEQMGLTGTNYVWIVTQSVIGETADGTAEGLPEYPVGMLGVSFPTSFQSLINQIPLALEVYAEGVERFVKNVNTSLVPKLSCTEGATSGEASWTNGEVLYRHIKSIHMPGSQGLPDIQFLPDGSLLNVQLKIMNLRKSSGNQHVWEQIGVWKSWSKESHGLEIKDIVWPGESHVPPPGVPEKFHLTIGFLEEPPFVNIAPPDPITGKCNVDRGVRCRMDHKIENNSSQEEFRNVSSGDPFQCCSGFCIDLLAKFAEDLQFEFDLVRVADPKWGTLVNGKWNGIMAELIAKKFDMVLTSLKINAERESVVDFTAPFLESGTAILVAKRTGIISPTAFLEPFDAASWLLIVFAAVQISAFSIFLFEWLSPQGYDMKSSVDPDHKFSLCRTFWMVWALLFQAPVQMDCPRAFTARFMASVWALFAVVFLAIYTANLAAFMITREEWDQFQGLDDPRFTNPQSVKPPLKFGTVPWTYTENALKHHFPNMHMYMKPHNKPNVRDGVEAVKRGDLDAFIYDGTVLDYIVGQDDECRLLTVGSWYAMTGYGAAFPRNSKHFQIFHNKMMDYSENGDLERLRRFWLTGTCTPRKQEKRSSEPLAPEQFLSAFFLLVCGVCLAGGLCSIEYIYCKYVRPGIQRTDEPGCLALLSLSFGKSLNFRGTVAEVTSVLKNHKCRDPNCDNQLMQARLELDKARCHLYELQAKIEECNIGGGGLESQNDVITGGGGFKSKRNSLKLSNPCSRTLSSIDNLETEDREDLTHTDPEGLDRAAISTDLSGLSDSECDEEDIISDRLNHSSDFILFREKDFAEIETVL